VGNVYAQNAQISDERQYFSINVEGCAWGYSKLVRMCFKYLCFQGFSMQKGFLPACKANWIIKLMTMVLWLLIMKYPARLAGVSGNTRAVRWIY